MNYTTSADFLYTGGDIDTIVIGNDIMPMRYGSHKKDLRGIDIAFLQDAVDERRRARQLSSYANDCRVFDNTLNLAQLTALADKISAVATLSSDWKWCTGNAVETEPIWDEYIYLSPKWLDGWPDQRLSGIQCQDMQVDSPLDIAPLEAMFANVKKMKQVQHCKYIWNDVWNGSPLSIDYTENTVYAGNSEQFVQGRIDYAKRWFQPVYFCIAATTTTSADLSYRTLTADTIAKPSLPSTSQVRDNNYYVGREVYGFFHAYEYGHMRNAALSRSWVCLKKISTANGTVSTALMKAAAESIRTSGISMYSNFRPKKSEFTYNSDYEANIYLHHVYIIDTLRDRTRWITSEDEWGQLQG